MIWVYNEWSKGAIFQHDGLIEQVKIAGYFFCFKLKAKWVSKNS